MCKWAVVNNHGHNEIWEYLTTMEDIKPYPYILKVVLENGFHDVMPVCMNRFGGYHSFAEEEIMYVVECDTEPDIFDLCAFFINEPSFSCGWIGPDGNTYTCSHYGHVSLAEQICKVMYKEKYNKYINCSSKINAPDDYLLNNGWIKIDASRNHFCLWDPDIMTDAAIKKLDELERKWHE